MAGHNAPRAARSDRSGPTRSPRRAVGADRAASATRRLEFLLATSPTVIYSDRTLPGYPTTYISESVRDLLGYGPEVVCQPGWFERNIHPDDMDRMARSLEEVLSGDETDHVYRLRHADGSYRWVRDVTRLVRDADGCPTEIVGSLTDVTATREADGQFRAMADAAAQGFWLVDPERGLVYANEAELRNLGLTWDEASGDGWIKGIHPEDAERIRRGFANAMKRGEQYADRGRMVHRDGRVVEFEVVAAPVGDTKGRPLAYVGQTVDVTERRLAEAALRESEARFHELMANLDVGFWLFDAEANHMEYVSPGYERMFGIGLQELDVDPWCWLERVHPDDRERVRGSIEVSPGHIEIEYRFVRRDGTLGIAQGRSFPVPSADGKVRRTAGVVNDITSLRSTEDHLRQLGAALAQTSDGVLLLDAEGVTLYANPAYERITGFSRAEIEGHIPSTLAGDHVDSEVRDTIRRGEVWKGRIQSRRSDGGEYLAEATVWPVADASSSGARIVVIVRDVTREAGLTEALEEESRARKALAESLGRIGGAGDASDVAEAVCDELMALPGADMASIAVFDPDGSATPIAFRGPPGSPIRVGIRLPRPRAAYLRERAALRAWVEDWRPRPGDGGYGARWAEVGLKSVAYVPVLLRGDVVGIITVGSCQAKCGPLLSAKLPELEEMAAVTGALLGESLGERMRTGELRVRLETVIATSAFTILYQPVVDLAGSAVVGFEALTRFADGTPPDAMFADADGAGLGGELEEATLRAAVAGADALPGGAWLSLNVSPALAAAPKRLGTVLNGGSRPVVLEITEQTPVADYDAIHDSLRTLGNRVRLAVDDAGAGFASLRHIIELRPAFVKLDMGLVRGVDRDPARQALVAGMVYYAGATGCALIAEGIETDGERRTLRRIGVSFGQGYLLGRPAPSRQLPAPLPRGVGLAVVQGTSPVRVSPSSGSAAVPGRPGST